MTDRLAMEAVEREQKIREAKALAETPQGNLSGPLPHEILQGVGALGGAGYGPRVTPKYAAFTPEAIIADHDNLVARNATATTALET